MRKEPLRRRSVHHTEVAALKDTLGVDPALRAEAELPRRTERDRRHGSVLTAQLLITVRGDVVLPVAVPVQKARVQLIADGLVVSEKVQPLTTDPSTDAAEFVERRPLLGPVPRLRLQCDARVAVSALTVSGRGNQPRRRVRAAPAANDKSVFIATFPALKLLKVVFAPPLPPPKQLPTVVQIV